MAESIERFAVSEKGFTLPIREVLTGRGFVTGKSGSGKSNTASVVAEELLERGLGLMIVDTDGEYAALKERYELLQVGGHEGCDREISAEDAGLIADLALEENVPIILDVSGYVDEEVGEDVIHAVVEELFVAEKHYQKPFLLFVEEAHEFIPERGGGDDLHKMLVRVAKRGRKRGLGVVAMSQRPAAVAKDYITQCDWLVWHRLTWENDTKVAGRILGGDAAESVQSLEDGEALVMTDWDESINRVQFRRKRTVDQGSTPDVFEAYGPPSARDAHVADSDEDGDGTPDDGDDPDAETADDSGDPDAGATQTDAGSRDEPDDEAVDDASHEPDVSDERDHPGPRESDWALEDVDISPRTRPPPEAETETEDRPIAPDDQPPTDAAVSSGGAANGASVRRRSRTRRSRELDEREEYDPVWELAGLIVYGYDAILEGHRRVLARLERGFHRLGSHSRTPEERGATGNGRVARLAARICAIAVVLAGYGLCLLAVALAVGG